MQVLKQSVRAAGRAAWLQRRPQLQCFPHKRQLRAWGNGLSRLEPPLLTSLKWQGASVPGQAPSWSASQLRSAGGAAQPYRAEDIEVGVGIMVEGDPKGLSEPELEALVEGLHANGEAVVRAAVLRILREEAEEEGAEARTAPPAPLELSLVLCDDAHISELNAEWRGKEGPTDVLSFELDDGEGEEDEAQLPVTVLGDVVISLDTAARQASERGCSLLAEVRVLLVHGVLHLLGYDHERGDEEAEDMAAAEAEVMAALGWEGQGLIAAVGGEAGLHDAAGDSGGRGPALHDPVGGASALAEGRRRGRGPRTLPEVQLLALDMDGTLLDRNSKVLPSSVAAIRAAIAAGVMVMLATGKARPAAVAAMAAVGLAGEGLVVSPRGPGIFLQGLTAYGRGGALVAAGELPPGVVAAAFEYAAAHDMPICGFMGEECVTLRMHPEVLELHERYYEPLARVAGGLGDVPLAGMRKLLFMTAPVVVDAQLKPHWAGALAGSGAETMQAVPNMLEVVPSGWNKWVALQAVLASVGVAPGALMAIGDGSNDLEMVGGAGMGVAMGNAVPAVKAVANLVVASNDEDGVAEAIERLIL